MCVDCISWKPEGAILGPGHPSRSGLFQRQPLAEMVSADLQFPDNISLSVVQIFRSEFPGNE
jgi:hypothetical protein